MARLSGRLSAPSADCLAPPARRRPCRRRRRDRAASRHCQGRTLARRSANGEAVLIGFERLGKIALRHQHVADLVVRDREIALPAGIAGVGRGQALGNGEAVADRPSAPRRDCPAPPARRRPCCTRPRDRAAIRHCRGRPRPAARRWRGCPDRPSAPPRDRPAPPARRRPCRRRPRDRAASGHCRGRPRPGGRRWRGCRG